MRKKKSVGGSRRRDLGGGRGCRHWWMGVVKGEGLPRWLPASGVGSQHATGGMYVSVGCVRDSGGVGGPWGLSMAVEWAFGGLPGGCHWQHLGPTKGGCHQPPAAGGPRPPPAAPAQCQRPPPARRRPPRPPARGVPARKVHNFCKGVQRLRVYQLYFFAIFGF